MLRDGSGLLQWASTFASHTGFGEQSKLIQLVEGSCLPAGASRQQLQSHCADLLANWLRIEGNAGAPLTGFYYRLVRSLASEPMHIGLRRARRVSSAHRRKSAKKDARSVRAFSLKTNPGGHHLHRTAKKSPFRRSMPSTPTTSCAELKARRRASTPTSTKKRKAKMQHDMTRARGAHAKDIFSQLHVP